MADKNVRVHRLAKSIADAPAGADAQLDQVTRKMSAYYQQGVAALAGGTVASAPSDKGSDIAAYLNASYPGASVTANTVWIWVINPVTGQRMLICYDEEVVLTQEKTAAGTKPIDPPIGVRVEKLMTIMSP
jgi:hypothetical protein